VLGLPAYVRLNMNKEEITTSQDTDKEEITTSQDQPIRRNCGAMFEHRRLLNEDPSYVAARVEIESRARSYELGLLGSAKIGITQIQVVVHVVWNTAAQNISDAQIKSQIDVLNRDYRMTNSDIGKVPAVWQSVRGDARIEFFLATKDPNGNPTNGITRTQTQATSFAQIGNAIKSVATGGANPWPADKYLNIWVAPRITSPQGDLLGYAQFPGGPAATDGVVILHSAFGTNGTAAAPYNKGRTATHEIGHWLNLFHIWGDDGTGCGGSDQVADTPNSAGPNYGCPTFPHVTCGNGPNGDMFMNYMDYTDDACMYMFTAGQAKRMQATIDGPRISISLEALSAGGDDLYQLHRDGRIWQYTGVPCTGQSCPGWKMLDNNTATVAIVASGKKLYQLHRDGRIWQYTGVPCTGQSCPGWKMLDNNPATIAIAAGGDKLYQLHRDGRIWRYTGVPCTGQSCPGWEMLDNNPATIAIAAGGDKLYQLHRDGRIWQYTGVPCTGQSCPGWKMLDNNPATIAIAAGGDKLYQLHRNGRIWQYTGVPCTGQSCPGWKMLDNNPATIAIAVDSDGSIYQLHRDGRIWQYTGVPCTGQSCPGWKMLDNNPATVAIVAGGKKLYQLHRDGRIWQYTGVPCTGQSCPGWKMLDNNPATISLTSGNAHR
jgi:hypothetical protein